MNTPYLELLWWLYICNPRSWKKIENTDLIKSLMDLLNLTAWTMLYAGTKNKTLYHHCLLYRYLTSTSSIVCWLMHICWFELSKQFFNKWVSTAKVIYNNFWVIALVFVELIANIRFDRKSKSNIRHSLSQSTTSSSSQQTNAMKNGIQTVRVRTQDQSSSWPFTDFFTIWFDDEKV